MVPTLHAHDVEQITLGQTSTKFRDVPVAGVRQYHVSASAPPKSVVQ
jgi:hypothetical protein